MVFAAQYPCSANCWRSALPGQSSAEELSTRPRGLDGLERSSALGGSASQPSAGHVGRSRQRDDHRGLSRLRGGKGDIHAFVLEPDGWREAAFGPTGDTRRFGTSLALLDDRLVVGAKGQGPIAGQEYDHAFLLERRNGLWEPCEVVDPIDPPDGDEFGTAVALSPSFFVVTSPGPVRSPRVTVFDLVEPQTECSTP